MKFTFSLVVILFMGLQAFAQLKDSSIQIIHDSVGKPLYNQNIYSSILDRNFFLNYKGTPQALAVLKKKAVTHEDLFYILTALFLVLGLLRTFFSRYFTTMFRVFFNTSLRQNQLTDQLEQAALPSLLFNIFFVTSLGLYIFVLWTHQHIYQSIFNWAYAGFSVLAVSVCYLVKYVSLLFTGWLTNYKPEAKIYIFSIFLLNKIIGMLLLPFTLLIAFSTFKVAQYAMIISFVLLSILLLSRFFRTYGLLQNRLKLNGFHFFIYIISLEILPIMIIYKTAMLFFRNSS